MLEFLSRPISPVEFLSRRFSLLALLAGLCWIGQGALQIGQYFGTEGPPFHHNALGLLLGESSMLSRRLSMPIHFGVYLTTGLALVAFADLLNIYQEGRRNVAIISASVAALAGLLGLAGLTLGRLFPNSADLPIVIILMEYGILPLSIAALLVVFGMWHAFDPLERWGARCIALFGLLTLSLAKLLYMVALLIAVGNKIAALPARSTT